MKKGGKLGYLLFCLVLCLSACSLPVKSLPVVEGIVNNAADGTDANNKAIIMTLYVNATSDILYYYDLIGENGASHTPNMYQIECWRNESTLDHCAADDIINIEVYENGTGYASYVLNWTIQPGDTLLELENLTLIQNASPNITILTPLNGTNISGIQTINVSVVNLSSFNISTVQYTLSNSTGNYTKDGEPGWSTLTRQQNTDYYSDTLNTSKFSNTNYLLYVKANTSRGSINITHSNITINNQLLPDLMVNSSTLSFSGTLHYENENITINATIYNIGSGTATNAIVQFFHGAILPENQIEENQTITIGPSSYATLNVTYLLPMGETNFSLIIDPPIEQNGTISETNETNNQVSSLVLVPSYAIITGNVTGTITLSTQDHQKLIDWDKTNTNNSNIFVVDSDVSLSFQTLQALGINTTNTTASDDFEELDEILGYNNFTDNINKSYTYDRAPRLTHSFSIFGKVVDNVPVINSTNNTNFMTGILWDMGDDANAQFDIADKEDVVFITKVNTQKQGKYGICDYEIRIPSALKQYRTATTDRVALYVEIK